MTEAVKVPKKPQSWEQMGVELEGGWDINRNDVAAKCKDAKSKTDGSVIVHAHSVGEITTRPHRKLDLLINDVRIMHPTAVDDSCGLHVHTSFTAMNTSLLTTPDFWKFFQEYWGQWGHKVEGKMTRDEAARFWARYEGRKRPGADRNYCEKKFMPSEQLGFNEHRYTQINFVSYKKYKTVELRMFPMFQNPDITQLCIEGVADMYDSFLADSPFPSINVDDEIKQEGDCFIETENLRLPEHSPWEEKQEGKYKPVVSGPDIFYSIEGANEMMLPWSKYAKTSGL